MIRMLFRLLWRGVRDLRLNPWGQAFTLTAVTLVVFLAGLFLMALVTLNQQLGAVRGETAFQIYWKPDADMAKIREEWLAFAEMPGFVSVKGYSPDEALAELGLRLGRNNKAGPDLAATFPFLASRSPLPATAFLTFAPPAGRLDDLSSWMEETARDLEKRPGVMRVAVTPLRDELGQAWRKVSRFVMWPSISFLALVLGLVVGNTMRLALLARGHEIEILHLVGAENWYIRLPLIVSGALQGLAGGGLALGLLWLVHHEIRDVLNFSPLMLEIYFPSPELCLALVLVPALMGIVSSWLAVRH